MKDRTLYFKPLVTVSRILLTYTGEIHIPIDFYCISRTKCTAIQCRFVSVSEAYL